MAPGEDKAWEILKEMSPDAVCRDALVTFDSVAGAYKLRSFGMDLHIDTQKRSIYSESPGAHVLLEKLGYFSILSILFYMTGARDIPLSGKLVQPANLKGGQIFFRGTHVLPLDRLASRYEEDVEGFIRRGIDLGGTNVQYGDASVELFPFPRVPATIVLWKGDEEFPAGADLLFDTTCQFHLPLDVIWSTAMKTILIMM